jgi:hypothetical protein
MLNHLIFRSRDCVASPHAWQPLTEAAETPRAVVTSTLADEPRLAELERHLVAGDRLHLAVDRPQGSLAQAGGANLTLVHGGAALPEGERHQGSLVGVDQEVAAPITLESGELTAGLAEALDGVVDPVGLDRVSGEACVHAGTLALDGV